MNDQYDENRLGSELLDPSRCRFTVWAPHADSVAVHIVSPREQVHFLEKQPFGYHEGLVEDAEKSMRYFYRLYRNRDGRAIETGEWPDPASRFQPQGVHGPSQTVDQGFEWRDSNWRGLPLSHYIIYELHVGTFTSEGTFDAVISVLDRLRDLGITALELMPVAQFPGNRNWGYDGACPFAVQDSYGGPEGLKRLVDACHLKGMAVILDVVYNHLGPEGNYLSKFGPYFTDFYKTPWGDAVNFDGPDSDGVRRYFTENALYWLSDFHFDALRLDAVHAINDFSAHPFLEELSRSVQKMSVHLNRRLYCIAESALNDTRIVRRRELGGFQLDAQWNDDFHHCLHTLLTGERYGYYVDYGRLDDMAKAMREGFAYSGEYSTYRRRRHGNSSRNIPAARFVVFSQNHDQVGNRMRGERLSCLVEWEQLKLSAGLVLLSPFIPLLFMGEEYGETAPFQFFVSHSDPSLVAAVRDGRRAEFAAFQWDGEPPDPQAESTFAESKLDHSLHLTGRHAQILAYYKTLIRLRTRIPALSRLSKKNMQVIENASNRTLFVHRRCKKDEVCLLFHFGKDMSSVSFRIPEGAWKKLIESSDAQWGGTGASVPENVVSTGEFSFQLGAHAMVALHRRRGGGRPA